MADILQTKSTIFVGQIPKRMSCSQQPVPILKKGSKPPRVNNPSAFSRKTASLNNVFVLAEYHIGFGIYRTCVK